MTINDGLTVNIRNKTPLHRQPVARVLIAQALVVLIATVICTAVFGMVAGYSALLGGLIAFLANVYFAFKAFRYFGARSARAIVQSFWAGEMGKQILAAALFALVFVGVKPLQPAALFVGYLLVLGAGASALLLMKNNPKH
ncbi:F0F1 ATP synthase subunit I [Pseudomonas sp. PS1]|uniref:F0F1 ATP synthase subunit I n=1 Tax=Stutzerimonas marianensis TaxID=2929513 RepID=A0A9X1W952_9GAMM|nr:F0F1 ATP synthase subunit I [Pseudomonas marianensis]MCJ0975752.1 F0F1 ATP synthase subunit I [Pseudomonas marianensis]